MHSSMDAQPEQCTPSISSSLMHSYDALQVMVTGSEPTGEYRVQYFTPAFLLNGNPQPSISSAPVTLGYATIFTVSYALASGSIGRCADLGHA